MGPSYFDKQRFDRHSIEQLYRIGGDYIDVLVHDGEVDMVKLTQCLIGASREVARTYLKDVLSEECRTGYNAKSVEYMLWCLGIVCMIWAAGVFRQKTLEGHCRVHQKPCYIGRQLHYQLHADVIDSFETVTSLLMEMRPDSV